MCTKYIWDWALFATVVKSLTPLAWPTTALIFISMFKDQIRDLFGRVTKANLLGQELEFDAIIRQLNVATNQLDAHVNASGSSAASVQVNLVVEGEFEGIEQIFATSPTLAFSRISNILDRHIQLALAVRGFLPDRVPVSWELGIEQLRVYQANDFPTSLSNAVTLFAAVSRSVLQGHPATTSDMQNAVEAARKIVKAVDNLPAPEVVAVQVGLELCDEHGTPTGVRGIVLNITGLDGTEQRVTLPTLRAGYEIGNRLTQEYDGNWGLTDVRYRDSATGDLILVTRNASMYAGRRIDEVYNNFGRETLFGQ